MSALPDAAILPSRPQAIALVAEVEESMPMTRSGIMVLSWEAKAARIVPPSHRRAAAA
jgi:hypothetical protein